MGSKIFTKEQEKQIVYMRRNGMGYKEIGNTLGVSSKYIWDYLKEKKLNIRPGGLRAVVKPKSPAVCKGCKYRTTVGSGGLKGCDYIGVEGHSRLLEEERNGGYRTDACCCYRKGKHVRNTQGICIPK